MNYKFESYSVFAHNNPPGLIRAHWDKYEPKEEKEAKALFQSLDKLELREYFKTLFLDSFDKGKQQGRDRFNRLKKRSEKSFTTKNDRDDFLKNEKRKILLRFTDSFSDLTFNAFKKIHSNLGMVRPTDHQPVVNIIFENLDSLKYYIDKLELIHNFQDNLVRLISTQKLIELLENPVLSLRELFRSSDRYDELIELLKNQNVIQNADHKHDIITLKEQYSKAFVCRLVIVLVKESLLRGHPTMADLHRTIIQSFNRTVSYRYFTSQYKKYIEHPEQIPNYDDSVLARIKS